MTLVVTKRKLVWWPVNVPVPKDDGGVQVRTFQVQFEILKSSRIDELQAEVMAALNKAGMGEQMDARLTNMQVRILTEAVKNTKDIVEKAEDGTETTLEHSDELLMGLLDVSYIRAAMFDAYSEAAAGRKAKN